MQEGGPVACQHVEVVEDMVACQEVVLEVIDALCLLRLRLRSRLPQQRLPQEKPDVARTHLPKCLARLDLAAWLAVEASLACTYADTAEASRRTSDGVPFPFGHSCVL